MDRLNRLFCTNRANRKNRKIKKPASVLASVLAFVLAAAPLIQGTDLFHDPFQGRLQAAEQTGMIIGAELYSEDFDGVADGELPEGWTLSPTLKNGGSAEVKDGKLIIDASTVELGKVLLPEALSANGNYAIEADVAFLSSRDASRWMSLVARQQTSDQDYYHMCVRRTTTASNGVEFAIRSASGWNVLTTASARKDLGLDREVHLKMCIADNWVYEYVDGKEVLAGEFLDGIRNAFATGGVGIQANFAKISVDNVKVSECRFVPDPDAVADKQYISHDFLKTQVISAAATIAEADSLATLDRLTGLEQRPENILLHVDGGGNVTSPDGSAVLGTLDEITDKVFRKMIPVFVVNSGDAADALSQFLKDKKLVDCMVMSADPALVAAVRKANTKIGGVIDCTAELYTGDRPASDRSASNIEDTLQSIIETTNANSAKTALISADVARKANVEYLQHRLITVWVKESAGPDEDALLHDAILSGANGIVTDTPEKLISAYDLYKNEMAVLVRNPLVIGHRGLPSSAPENTIESAKEAVAAGVDCIELDVRLSSDGEIYIYHDNDLSSLTTGSGTVNSHTAAELDKLKVLRSGSYGTFEKYSKVKLPSLREFFEALKDDDVMFFIEIKEEAGNISQKVADMVQEFGLTRRCCMITFLSSQVSAFQKALPGMSTGQLMGTPSGKQYETVVKNIIAQIAPENATFNASGVNDTKLVRALMYRGITAWPWTYNNGNTGDAYLLGVGGITTDYCNVVSHVPVRIDIGEKYEFTLNPTDSKMRSVPFHPVVYSRMGVEKADKLYTAPEPVILEGAEHVEIEGNTIRALSDGTVRLVYRLRTSLTPDREPDNLFSEFTIYTQVITLHIDSTAEPEATTDPGSQGRSGPGNRAVEVGVVCGIAGVVIAACCIALAAYGKKKNNVDQSR
jgi:glycerophosphoryl diester phosphodiesterase